jgi:L-arabinokinase
MVITPAGHRDQQVLVAYVSGHGYGHATRTAEALRVLRERAPSLPMAVRTEAPAFLFERVGGPIEVQPLACDVGLVQKDALTIDEPATAAAVRSFLAGWDRLVAAEARFLRDSGARLVLGDIPPLAFAAADAASVPSMALGNFSWDWIYRHLARREPALRRAADLAAAAYDRATLLLRLPFTCDLSAFPRVEDVPLIARRPSVDRKDARRRLGLDARPAVLLSFGGVGLPGLEPAAFAGLVSHLLLVTGAVAPGAAANVRRLGTAELQAAGLGYPDLVGACDVVVSKPGYGIVSDCIGARTRLVYTDRGDFPEYPVLVAEMPRYLPVAYVSNEDLRDGRLGEALKQVLAAPFPDTPRTNGAAVVAEKLLAAL